MKVLIMQLSSVFCHVQNLLKFVVIFSNLAGCSECGDEPLGSCATELVSYSVQEKVNYFQ
jgi:hypothetical protein